MIYILESDKLKVKVSSVGAELQSIRRLDDGTEYLWQGDPAYWSGRATNLFPICGRMIDGKYTYQGVEYTMPIHGFAKLQEWKVIRQKANTLTLQLQDTEETRAMYPFHFSLDMTYTLNGEELSVAMIVHNLEDKVMPFAVGGHPGFNVPLTSGESFEEYSVTFDAPCEARRLRLSETCFYLDASDPFPLEEGKTLRLRHALFDHDAIFLRDTGRALTLHSDNGERKVHLSFPDMPFVGLWHKPHTQAPYVCIEPWRGVPALDGAVNALETKLEMEQLEPQGVYRNTYTMTFQ